MGSGAELIQVLNTNRMTGGRWGSAVTVTKFVPLLENGNLAGAVALRYRLQATATRSGQKYWPGLLILGMGLAPFAVIIFFTYWMARGFSRRLHRPVQELIEAAQRIRQQDLDFTINYEANNEIGGSVLFDDLGSILFYDLQHLTTCIFSRAVCCSDIIPDEDIWNDEIKVFRNAAPGNSQV